MDYFAWAGVFFPPSVLPELLNNPTKIFLQNGFGMLRLLLLNSLRKGFLTPPVVWRLFVDLSMSFLQGTNTDVFLFFLILYAFNWNYDLYMFIEPEQLMTNLYIITNILCYNILCFWCYDHLKFYVLHKTVFSQLDLQHSFSKCFNVHYSEHCQVPLPSSKITCTCQNECFKVVLLSHRMQNSTLNEVSPPFNLFAFSVKVYFVGKICPSKELDICSIFKSTHICERLCFLLLLWWWWWLCSSSFIQIRIAERRKLSQRENGPSLQ